MTIEAMYTDTEAVEHKLDRDHFDKHYVEDLGDHLDYARYSCCGEEFYSLSSVIRHIMLPILVDMYT